MKVFTKLLFASVATASLLVASPNIEGKSCGGACSHDKEQFGLKAPHGILADLYQKASAKQKREILQIEYDFYKAAKTQTAKFQEQREVLLFDIKNLQVDLEEAKYDRDSTRATNILHRITKKQADLRRNNQDEKNLKYLLNEERIKKINGVLQVK